MKGTSTQARREPTRTPPHLSTVFRALCLNHHPLSSPTAPAPTPHRPSLLSSRAPATHTRRALVAATHPHDPSHRSHLDWEPRPLDRVPHLPEYMPPARGHTAVATASNTQRRFTIDYETQVASRAASPPPHCLVRGARWIRFTQIHRCEGQRESDKTNLGDSPTRVAARGNPGWRPRQLPTTHQIRPLFKTHTRRTEGRTPSHT